MGIFKKEPNLSVGEYGLDALILIRHSFRGGFFGDFQKGFNTMSVENIMTRFAYGEFSDPRDQIYALLVLMKPKAGVEPLSAITES